MVQAGVGPLPVGVKQASKEDFGELGKPFIALGIGPFSQAGLDRSFGFAICARSVARASRLPSRQSVPEAARLVSGVVDGQNALEAHAERSARANGTDQPLQGLTPRLLGSIEPNATMECSSMSKWDYSQPMPSELIRRLQVTR